MKDTTQGKRETSGSEPRTGVEFGSHGALIEQGSISPSLDDYVHKAATPPTYRMNVRQKHFLICVNAEPVFLGISLIVDVFAGKADIIYCSRRR